MAVNPKWIGRGVIAAVAAAPVLYFLAIGQDVYDIPVLGFYLFIAFVTWRAVATGVGMRVKIGGGPDGAILYMHKCKHCTGGTQVRNYDRNGHFRGWGPVPPEHWVIYRDTIQSLPASARNCTECLGKGFLLLPYAPIEATVTVSPAS